MLIFIDTNIFLDFYRFSSDVSLEYVSKLIPLSDKIIMTPIIEMEFLKNRQRVLLSTVKQIKSSDKISFPEILSKDRTAKSISKQIDDIQHKVNRTKDKIYKIIRHYDTKDNVYKNFKKVFLKNDDITLKANSEIFDKIYNQAKKRFELGYPPRKGSDVSFGDSINWEWIIEVCNNKRTDVIIVTRDSDYGHYIKGTMVMNDWLTEEFKRRVRHNKNIFISKLFTGTLKDHFGVDISNEQIRYEIQHSTLETRSSNFKKHGNFINYLKMLSNDKQYFEIESLIIEHDQDLMESDPILGIITGTNAVGWGIDDLTIITIDIQDLVSVVFEFSASAWENREDSPFSGDKLHGIASAAIDDYGDIEFYDIEAELDWE